MQYTVLIMFPAITKANSIAPATERFNTTRGGAIAVSGILNSITKNATNVTAKVTRRPMILGADHEYIVPPHSSARIRHTIEGVKNKRPMGFRRLI
jgi:hypothetical protein